MLYAFNNFLAPDVFQSWFAAARDQATMQLIAASTVQQHVETELRKAVESSALLLEQEMELPFALGAQSTHEARAQRRDKQAKRRYGSKH